MTRIIPNDRYIVSKSHLQFLERLYGVQHINYLEYKKEFDKKDAEVLVHFDRTPAFEIGNRVMYEPYKIPCEILTYRSDKSFFSRKNKWNGFYLVRMNLDKDDTDLEMWCHESKLAKLQEPCVNMLTAWASFDKLAKIKKMPTPKDGNKIHPTQKPIKLYNWPQSRFR